MKKGTQGQTEYTYGYKLHLMADCEYELPIAANVSPGNVHDVKRATNLLSEARFTARARFRPKYVMADKGYSSDPLRRAIRVYGSKPIIDPNPGHKRAVAKTDKGPA